MNNFVMFSTIHITRIVKRLIDVSVSAIALALLVPVGCAVAIAIRLGMGSPVLFTQVRPGYRERPFTIFKFRTMRNAIDSSGKSLPDSERMTPLGRFLRKTSLDEIPQLWNVLRGDMSLVGPRPLLVEYLPLYSQHQRRRHDAKPGITGWAQVNGRNAVSWEERLNYDVWYVDHWSLTFDFKILLLTLPKVLKSEGVNREGHATMPEFGGNIKANCEVVKKL